MWVDQRERAVNKNIEGETARAYPVFVANGRASHPLKYLIAVKNQFRSIRVFLKIPSILKKTSGSSKALRCEL